jgi:membrane protein implicated in regulation of membrane protease activity
MLDIILQFFGSATPLLIIAAILCLGLEMALQLPYVFLTFSIFFALSAVMNAIGYSFEWQMYAATINLLTSFFMTRIVYKTLTRNSIRQKPTDRYIGEIVEVRVVQESEETNSYFYGYKKEISNEVPVSAPSIKYFVRALTSDGRILEVDWRGKQPPIDGERAAVIGVSGSALTLNPLGKKGEDHGK